MQINDFEHFEDSANKLMAEAMKLSVRHLESLESPPPQGAAAHLLQHAVVAFVSATNVLIFVLRHLIRKV